MVRQPIAPLATETLLVQSNGIAQWLKMALATTEEGHPGIFAGIQIELPNQFVWQLYRAVLGEAIPKNLPYDKANLGWRLLQILPDLATDPTFAAIAHYLKEDHDGRKSYHLALRLADLFDQYQVYRADWLAAWSRGEDTLLTAAGQSQPIPDHQQWQPALWRALRADLATHAASTPYSSRADLHQQVLEHLAAGQIHHPNQLPERVMVFGIATLPQQTVELLAALAQHRPVLIAVLNPCRYYWGDLIPFKEAARNQQRRHARKPGLPQLLDPETLHLHAPPLLAALGKQARDYINLLDQFDLPEKYRNWFSGRIDLFSEPCEAIEAEPLLRQLQLDLLELNPLPNPKRTLAPNDRSLSFHLAHSRLREVEILHDHLLADFAADPTLRPRDCMVMVPDIQPYAPLIHAIFGRFDFKDPRYLPYTLADQRLRGHNPLLLALDYLLHLPQQRITLTEVFDLLEVRAIQQRFQFNPDTLPALRLWLSEAGVRWGLDAAHRQALDLPKVGDAFSWATGLERLLLGYAMGDEVSWQGRLSYAGFSGLAAADLGPLLALLHTLEQWYPRLTTPNKRPLPDWSVLLLGEEGLLNALFDFSHDEADRRIQQRLLHAFDALKLAAQSGDFEHSLTLSVVREAWLDGVEESGLSQRFMAGSITLSTLLPMRAIPFKRIYILGLNDGDYPRVRRHDDFDLMARDRRVGDRSRRDDDRYLFLEAILSARQALYLSWIGYSSRDNAPVPASVLVNQLRDLIQQGWTMADQSSPLRPLTTHYPLQPFSTRYFNGELWTYSHEWQPRPIQATASDPVPLPPLPADQQPLLSLKLLDDLLAHPVHYYLAQRLQLPKDRTELIPATDEPFTLNTLEHYQLTERLLTDTRLGRQPNLAAATAYLQQQSKLPLHGIGHQLTTTFQANAEAVWGHWSGAMAEYEPRQTPLLQQITLQAGVVLVVLEENLTDLYMNRSGHLIQILLRPKPIWEKSELKRHPLRRLWLRQLLANSCGTPLTTGYYGTDGAVELCSLSAEDATAELNRIVAAALEGLKRPLPVMPKTALTWLLTEEDKRYTAAAKCYEPDEQWNRRIPERDTLTARYYPDFPTLHAAGLPEYAAQIYGGLAAARYCDLTSPLEPSL